MSITTTSIIVALFLFLAMNLHIKLMPDRLSVYPYNVGDWSHVNSCDNAVTDSNTVTCGDQTYKTVRIGSQTWMAENLNYNEKDGSYDNSPYGRLYHWYHALLICPSGWHLPDSADWTTLIDFIGSDAGTKLKAKNGWDENGNGTDDYGFSALPGGCVVDILRWDGWFGYWWGASSRCLLHNKKKLSF